MRPTGSRAHRRTMSTTTLRHLRGREVRIRREHGELQGTMLSATRHSLWLLVGDQDVIVELHTIREVQPAR
jgi:hypothetical protein